MANLKKHKRLLLSIVALLAVGALSLVIVGLRQGVGSLSELAATTSLSESPDGHAISDTAESSAQEDVLPESTIRAGGSSWSEALLPRQDEDSPPAEVIPTYARAFEMVISSTGEVIEWELEEVERGENYSLFRTTADMERTFSLFERYEYDGDVESEAYWFRHDPAAQEQACRLGFRYYFVLAAANESEFYEFFTNDSEQSLKEFLGDMYSESAQRHFDKVGYRIAPTPVVRASRTCAEREY